MSFIIQDLTNAGSSLANYFGSVSNDIAGGISSIITQILKFLESIANGIEQAIGSIENYFTLLSNDFHNFITWIQNALAGLWDNLRVVFGDILGFFNNLGKYIVQGFQFISSLLVTAFNDFKNLIVAGVSDFIHGIISFGDVIYGVMTYALSFIRYEINYFLYYVSTNFSNLGGGFIMGLFVYDVQNLKMQSLTQYIRDLFATSLKYFVLDATMQSLFFFIGVAGKVKKPVPPQFPNIGGIKL